MLLVDDRTDSGVDPDRRRLLRQAGVGGPVHPFVPGVGCSAGRPGGREDARTWGRGPGGRDDARAQARRTEETTATRGERWAGRTCEPPATSSVPTVRTRAGRRRDGQVQRTVFSGAREGDQPEDHEDEQASFADQGQGCEVPQDSAASHAPTVVDGTRPDDVPRVQLRPAVMLAGAPYG